MIPTFLPPLKIPSIPFIQHRPPHRPNSLDMEPKPRSPKSDTPEWELGLPSGDELPPLHQNLLSLDLAAAFGILPSNCSTIFRREESGSEFEPLKLFPEKNELDGFKVRRRVDSGDGAAGSDESNSGGDESGTTSRAVKRPRLVWTPQLHKRFVDVIERLGVDKAVPKVIMEMMNVEGLTRENVASQLQKYRLYLKKMEGNSADVNSSSMSISANGSERHGSGAYESSCNGGFGAMQSSGVHLNSVAMMPLPSLVGVGYGGGQLGMALATGKGGFCGMESGGYGATFWTRQRG